MSQAPRPKATQRVVFQPESGEALAHGAGQLAAAIRPTLGPLPRRTMVEHSLRSRSPELLDDGGTIARRVIAITDPDADMGAMLLRHALWRLRSTEGDGAATAAVLFQAILAEGRKVIAAGGNPMRLRSGLDRGMRLVHDALGRLARPLDGQQAIVRVAEALCYDPPLAAMLGEIMSLLGPYGCIEIREGRGRTLERRYTEGAYWNAGWLSATAISDTPGAEIRLHDTPILVSDLQIEDVDALAHVLTVAAAHDARSLVIMAQSVSERALALLRLNHQRQRVATLPVKAPATPSKSIDDLQDIAALAGARPFLSAVGDTLKSVRWEDLGRARQAYATADYFGIVGGQGEPLAVQQRIGALISSHTRVQDDGRRRSLQERIGRLHSGAAQLWVGADSESELAVRKDLAERSVNALRGALREGVLPGGGSAFLACRGLLAEQLAGNGSTTPEDKAALRILERALAAPFCAILENAGYESGPFVARVEAAGPPYGIDIRTGQMTDLLAAGIADVTSVTQAAWRAAVSTAGLALTTDVLVHSAHPQQSLET